MYENVFRQLRSRRKLIVGFVLSRERRCHATQNGREFSTAVLKSSTFQTSRRVQAGKLTWDNYKSAGGWRAND